MTNKLYVGNLTDDVTEEDLLDNFGDLGTCVSAKIIRYKNTGSSRGFAFVEMATEEEAREVVKICKGVELDGQKLNVTQAQPQHKRSGGSKPGKRKRK
jgi:RNA recognition motif-containing protein